MDPNETLRQLRHAVEGESADIFELFSALDGWLSKGGFLPTDWMPGSDAEGDECPGHESLSGASMGESTYCDGSCQE